ncbi:hypothetical protein B9N43_08810 [Denitratisoma sp. DHT3]|uniref:flagellar filament capping protein FliD n=1 Tax=Denitratisoma sp. DHT3 TaxID=1981880 RepID=UPI001198C756|nr:flagellar filament capping protein FliD [Denitratisoma sp. DHT3]QDX81333.1 hypothetical protein B9N43_08810 [Denitratisoma sp. DHT3]
MAGLSSPGVGSGLDINSLVSRLMEVERLPLAKLDKQEADYQAKITAYGTLKGAFSSLQTAVKTLNSTTRFNTTKATVADTSVLSATTNSIAKPGTHSIEVSFLAQQHKLASAAFADPAATLGSGTLTIDFGSYDGDANEFTVNGDKTSKSITIDSSNNSLAGIRDAINQAKIGVSASLINDGEGYRLTLSSDDAGKANSMRILVSDGDGNNTDLNGLSRLAYDPTAGGAGKNLQQSQPAQNAEFKIDGIFISKSTNVVGDALPGVTLNLLKTTESNKPTTLTVARDTAGVKSAVEGFVKAYNDLAGTVQGLGGYDFKTQKGGILQGDATLRGVQSQMRNLLSQRLEFADGGLNALSDIGVSFQRDGTLSLDSARLDKVLADPSKNVASLFATMGVPSDSLISYVGASAATQPGRYGIDISQVATRGTATAGVTLNIDDIGTTIDASNKTLTLNLNGVATSVTLTEGSYSRTQLVAELQSRINSDATLKAGGHTVSVSQENGVLKLTSTLYGATSRVQVTGGSAAAALFGTASSVNGMDVAGTIGGQLATGKGQVLTGNGAMSGLQLLVEGGNIGARGTIGFSTGMAAQIDQTLTKLLGEDGAISSRTAGIDRSVKDIESRREVLERRIEQVEKRYRTQFNALDQAVASMQQTSAYLSQQLASLSSMNKSN